VDHAAQSAWLELVEAPTLCLFSGRKFAGYCGKRCRCVMADLANRREAGDPVIAIWVNPDGNKAVGYEADTTP
jgi:hypothetical protein